jgi:hypothetical protein
LKLNTNSVVVPKIKEQYCEKSFHPFLRNVYRFLINYGQNKLAIFLLCLGDKSDLMKKNLGYNELVWKNWLG